MTHIVMEQHHLSFLQLSDWSFEMFSGFFDTFSSTLKVGKRGVRDSKCAGISPAESSNCPLFNFDLGISVGPGYSSQLSFFNSMGGSSRTRNVILRLFKSEFKARNSSTVLASVRASCLPTSPLTMEQTNGYIFDRAFGSGA